MAPRSTPPAVLVHGLADARAALAAASELAVEVTLLSTEAAAAQGGATWFRELLAVAAQERPGAAFAAILDCGNRAGDAQGALAVGVRCILFTGASEVAARLSDIAGQLGATVLTERPPALDVRGHRHPVAVCRQWLSGAGGLEG